ncbi:VOC family protein [Gudongella sp. SC589]|uniref:VOC family protein n=1 Tax=Gudongella sp. SC589 TaxID=3385990 RepID=UPI003904751D
MKFCWTTLTVNDMDKSIEFYTEIVGLKVDRRFNAGPDTEICFLGDGETKLELICDTDIRPDCLGEGMSMGFQVESLEKIEGVLEQKGIPVHSGPFQPNPHIRFLYVKDPDGFKVQFVENV